VIVGAGPTGVLLAIELARRGVEVRILDRQRSRPQVTRAIGIHARTLEVFHQLGIVEQFLERGHQATGMAVHTRARRSTHVDFGGLDSPYPFVLMLGQDQTQEILDRKPEELGVSIERGVEVVKVDQGIAGVQLAIRHPGDDDCQTPSAGWAVGCDGAHSIVRRYLGVPFDGDDYGQDWLMTEVNIEWPLAPTAAPPGSCAAATCCSPATPPTSTARELYGQADAAIARDAIREAFRTVATVKPLVTDLVTAA